MAGCLMRLPHLTHLLLTLGIPACRCWMICRMRSWRGQSDFQTDLPTMLNFHLMEFSARKAWHLSSLCTFCNHLAVSLKVDPLSEYLISGLPLRAMNRLKLAKKFVRMINCSGQAATLQCQIYLFFLFLPFSSRQVHSYCLERCRTLRSGYR